MEGKTGRRVGLKCFGMQGAGFKERESGEMLRVGRKKGRMGLIGRSEGETSTCDANKKPGRVTLVLYRTTPLVRPLFVVTLYHPSSAWAPLQRPKVAVEKLR